MCCPIWVYDYESVQMWDFDYATISITICLCFPIWAYQYESMSLWDFDYHNHVGTDMWLVMYSNRMVMPHPCEYMIMVSTWLWDCDYYVTMVIRSPWPHPHVNIWLWKYVKVRLCNHIGIIVLPIRVYIHDPRKCAIAILHSRNHECVTHLSISLWKAGTMCDHVAITM